MAKNAQKHPALDPRRIVDRPPSQQSPAPPAPTPAPLHRREIGSLETRVNALGGQRAGYCRIMESQ
eukprot:9490142-Pyramimonas_sp.AAC.1